MTKQWIAIGLTLLNLVILTVTLAERTPAAAQDIPKVVRARLRTGG
jgi:hypothetical protein